MSKIIRRLPNTWGKIKIRTTGPRSWSSERRSWTTLLWRMSSSSASAYLEKYFHPTMEVIPPTYEQSSEFGGDDFICPLMGASALVDPKVVVEYGSRTLSDAESVIEELEEEEKSSEECDEWAQAVVDDAPARAGGQHQGSYRDGLPATPTEEWGTVRGTRYVDTSRRRCIVLSK